MQQQMSCVTLGIADLVRSKRFYVEGFGWTPVFENPEIVFYQMNGLMLGTWLSSALEADSHQTDLVANPARPGAFNLAHNVETRDGVQPALDRLAAFGGRILRNGDAPPHGGFRGYVADPDEHVWEIAWNPGWPISPEGYVSWGV